MQESKSLREITAELEAAVYEIIQSRPPIEQPKKGILAWTGKSPKLSYTDASLQAVKVLCAKLPDVAESYANSTSKLMFAAANAGVLLSLKSTLDTLDPETWTPKVVDEDTKKLAQAFSHFAGQLLVHNQTALHFLEKSKPEQLSYELVKSLPKNPKLATIYIKKSEKDAATIEYSYVHESDPSKIITGTMPERRLGAHKERYADPSYFKANATESTIKDKEDRSIGHLLHTDTGYYQHSPRVEAFDTLQGMRKAIQSSITEYENPTKPADNTM